MLDPKDNFLTNRMINRFKRINLDTYFLSSLRLHSNHNHKRNMKFDGNNHANCNFYDKMNRHM